jgi:NitT/TauT family transport system substrate-binding protein
MNGARKSLPVRRKWRRAATWIRRGLKLGFVVALAGGCMLWENRVEQTTIDVAYMKTSDTGPLRYAKQEGYFWEAGILDVNLIPVDSGREAADLLHAGKVDLAYGTYPAFIKDGSRDADAVRFVSAASECAPGSCLLVTLPSSGVNDISGLAHKRIAVTARGTFSDSLVMYALMQHGIDLQSVTFVTMPFDDMDRALDDREVDGAFVTEPYLSQMQERPGGLSVITDLASGPLQNIPSAVYAANKDFAVDNPNTIATFRRIMHTSVREARADWGKVAPIISKDSYIPSDAALSAARLNISSTTNNADHVQDLSDLMVKIGTLQHPFDVRDLFLPVNPCDDLTSGSAAGRLTANVAASACLLRRRHRRRPNRGLR